MNKKLIIWIIIIAAILILTGTKITFLGATIDFDKVLDPRAWQEGTGFAKIMIYVVIGSLLYLFIRKR